jgi:hypothetical protein
MKHLLALAALFSIVAAQPAAACDLGEGDIAIIKSVQAPEGECDYMGKLGEEDLAIIQSVQPQPEQAVVPKLAAAR